MDTTIIMKRPGPANGRDRLAIWFLAAGGALCLALPLAPALGLLAGVGLALALGNPAPGATSRCAGVALKGAIVLLGAGMNLGQVWRTGTAGAGYTLAGVAVTLGLGLWLGKRAGVSRDLALLLAAGTAICGGSAVAAISGVIRPKAQDTSVALAVVFLLNAVALFVFPPVGRALGFSAEQFGLWAALAIHDTSSVAGAASAYGGAALSVAVTVKLARALWIVPVAACASAWVSFGGRGEKTGERRAFRWKCLVPPGFIVGYVTVAAFFTWTPLAGLPQVASLCGHFAHRGMTLALFLIGSGLSREALRRVGVAPLGVAVLLWVAVSAATAGALQAGWIK